MEMKAKIGISLGALIMFLTLVQGSTISVVPGQSIQDAINSANPMDIIEVSSGTYKEYLEIDKQLTLIGVDTGEGKPIIDPGDQYPGGVAKIETKRTIFHQNYTETITQSKTRYMCAVVIRADGVIIENFEITHPYAHGIAIVSDNNKVKGIYIGNQSDGIVLFGSNNVIEGNRLLDNEKNGIILDEAHSNKIFDNIVLNNSYGIYIHNSTNNVLYNNSMMLNKERDAYDNSSNQWDNGAIGNYYSAFICTEPESNNLCDMSYNIPGGSNIDRYPLVEPNTRFSSQPAIELDPQVEANQQDALSPTARILFDETRPQPYVSNGLLVSDTAYNLIDEKAWWGGSDLATILRNDGFEVFSESSRPLTADKLRSFDVLVMILSDDDYSSSEIEAVYDFVQEGGGLFLVPNAWVGRENFAINGVARRFGVIFAANGALTDSTNNYLDMPLYIRIDDISEHPITRGVESLVSEYGTYLKETDGSEVLARTSSNARFDELVLNGIPTLVWETSTVESSGSYPVLAVKQSGQGRVVFFSGFVLDNDHLVMGDNGIFSLYAIRWLAGRDIIISADREPLYSDSDAIATSNPAPVPIVTTDPRAASSDGSGAILNSASPTDSRPVTGTYIKPLIEEGYGELLIINGLGDDAVAVLTKSSGSILFSVYVRSGEQFRVQGITDGTYRVLFTSGVDWDNARKEFGGSQEYYSMEGTLPFTTRTTSEGIEYTIYEVTLHTVSDGNVDRLPMTEEEFPRLG